jgi:alpha-L-rhamnosidase
MPKKRICNPLAPVFLILVITACSQISNVNITELRTEGLNNPLGIDRVQPRFSWMMESPAEDEHQTAYQLLVASSPSLLTEESADLWDSEKVISESSTQLEYRGTPLSSGMEVFWKVRIWNVGEQASAWSDVASFSMGLLEPGDWKASWIGLDRAVGNDRPDIENRVLSARYLRKEFELEKPVKRAMAYIVGMGTYELYLNGEKVGDHVLSPALSEYLKRSYYVTYDVTDQFMQGSNAVGVILGNGRYFSPRINAPTPTQTYGFPKLLMQMEIEYEDGSGTRIVSDESWTLSTNGPIRENNEYDGETYDARMEISGWNKAGFDDLGWMNAEPVDPASPVISSQMIEPIRITETIQAVEVSNPQPGVYIVDLGQNMVGWTKLSVKAEKGTVIKQRFAETLKEDGTLYLDNIRGAKVTDTYITKGDDTEIYEPRFVYHGFRYVELTGYPGKPDLTTIEGKVIHDDLTMTGQFECSDPLINQIYKNAVWGIRGNYRSIPTDCPQRDERQGWLGDRAAGSQGESYLFNNRNLYKKWLVDIFDAQKESGSISDVCPAYWPFYSDNVTWAGTPIQLVNMLYEQYGDLDVIEDSYVPMKKWMDYMIANYLKDDLMPRDVYGDWCVPPIDPKLIHTKDPARLTAGDYLGSSFFYHNLKLMQNYADLLGKTKDVEFFNDQSFRMKQAFNKKFFNPENIQYSNNSATANILALAFDLVPSEHEKTIFNNLVEKIEVEHHSHITTGLIGQEYFNRVLTKYGRADLAFTVNTQTDYPGYGYMIEYGATTIWELWNGNTADPAMNSGNHVMLLGDFLIWLYEDLAGIKPDPLNPGFKHIVMKPTLVDGLDHVKASHFSPYGWIESEWEISGDLFDWQVTVPPNSHATVFIPGQEEALEIGSGTHHFTSQLNK